MTRGPSERGPTSKESNRVNEQARRPVQLSDQPWLVVLGSTLALIVGNGPIMQFTFGVFLKPLTAAFGIQRGVASFALTIGLLATALALPVVGRMADRFGPRAVGLAAVPLFAAGIAAAGLFSPSVGLFMVLFALAGVAAAGQTPLVYLKAIALRVDRARGIALATALCGVGIGSIVMPLLAQFLIDRYGWRLAYCGIAAVLVVIAIPVLLLMIPGHRAAEATAGSVDAADAGAALPGVLAAEALRGSKFWRLAVCMFLAAGAANGTIAHVVPLLTDRGVPAAEAAAAVAAVGATAIVGRLLGGFLLDRFWAPAVAAVFFAGMIVGIGTLATAQTVHAALFATIMLGLGLGVEADLVGFLVSRYFGTRAFGSLFGLSFASFMLGSSLGPIFMGAMFDLTRSYTQPLIVLMGCAAVAGAGLLTMGAYDFPASRTSGGNH
jgi:MFS family permease